MFAVFEQYLQRKEFFTPAEIEHIRAASTVRTLRKRQYLLQAGDGWQSNAFVASGCLRTYSVDAKGLEHIIGFAVENWWATDQESLLSHQPSRYNIEAMEDSTVIVLHNDDFERLRREIPAFDKVVKALVLRSFMAAQDRVHSAISYSAEQKYREFLQKYPGLVQRIPQHMVASYLGVTAETLSRIRRQW
ncbi:Crp/Fnr family transcriptional regulator [Hymenobacter fodinae]|uniref:Crp/Fnr family transcriptional regulator n=1 Tax=Hymenobacter fodinae TaxID=2510796 RepID=A0A4Z0P1S3_9BACT|nr:Crp/Fnr family transcriptional regulator [Hymenobacter fodinae]TGE03775.1 Crp/Fnr family transcriptional regulator [Hymenobacter fodinae]